MGECTVDSKDGAPIRSAIEMLRRFSGEVALLVPGWEERLRQNPQELETLEREIVQSYKRGAGLMIAGLVSVVMQTQEFAEASEQTRQEFGSPLATGRNQQLGIRLPGGVNMWATIDGTFTGPDATSELVAMHLHRLGAAKAESITFVSDGAIWIWDHIDNMLQHAGIPETVRIYQVLDNCHAAHHISLALGSLNLDAQTRAATYRELRTRLRNGQWRLVVKELQRQIVAGVENETLLTEIAYLVKHGEAGRLRYTLFKALGLPLGSGAIESSIRRVINMRLKNSSTFWREENAESMLQIRSLVISGRWDERLNLMRLGRKSINLTDWSWNPQIMSKKVESNSKPTKTTA